MSVIPTAVNSRPSRYRRSGITLGLMQQWAPELRAEAVRELRTSHEAINTASRRLGVPPSTLRRWLREDATQRADWFPPITPNETGAAPRMIKVLAAFASPSPKRQRRSSVVTLLLSVAWVALCGGVAFDVVSDDVTSNAWARGLTAVVLGAAAGGVAGILSSRFSLPRGPSSALTPLPLLGRYAAAPSCATVDVPRLDILAARGARGLRLNASRTGGAPDEPSEPGLGTI